MGWAKAERWVWVGSVPRKFNQIVRRTEERVGVESACTCDGTRRICCVADGFRRLVRSIARCDCCFAGVVHSVADGSEPHGLRVFGLGVEFGFVVRDWEWEWEVCGCTPQRCGGVVKWELICGCV